MKDRRLRYHRKIQSLGGGTGLRRNWPHLKSVCAVVKQIDREHKASECGLVRLVQVLQAWRVYIAHMCVHVCGGVNHYNHTYCARWVGLAECQLSAGEHL